MSTVFLHVGQAGCQIGEALWPALFQERPGYTDFFAPRLLPCPRAILVDAEPKVVEKIAASSDGYSFDPRSVATAQSGRGGNFALGYTGGHSTPSAVSALDGAAEPLWTRALNAMRLQVEACHGGHLGTLMSYSLGGGTGSGLGSRLLEEVRDAYPKMPLLVTPVLPISSGENPMQCYNVLLSLSWLQDLADGVLLYENDSLMALSEAEQASGASGFESTSLASMNGIIARDLIPHLCPDQVCDLSELLSVAPVGSMKFAQLFSAGVKPPRYETQTTTKAVLEALGGTVRLRSRGDGNVLAARCVVRGMRATALAPKTSLKLLKP
ncbi:unnamed protein product [Durusdinium trenchii]|uniref:Tubulin/FtsZ GTPase domain-containing protein n=1 Tax=Durusdinium trenchii TaxID=1381693 RepID=A0ABP0ND93_9DINO